MKKDCTNCVHEDIPFFSDPCSQCKRINKTDHWEPKPKHLQASFYFFYIMGKPWYLSKTKLGAVIGGVGTVLVATGGAISGELSTPMAIEMAIAGIAAVLFGLGLRNAISDLE